MADTLMEHLPPSGWGDVARQGDIAAVKAAAEAVLDAMELSPDKAMKPKILASKIVTRIDPGHAFLINRNKGGSMILAGETLFVLETEPAAYAILAANAAEKAATIKIEIGRAHV